jgi:hypothetical protein
MLHEHSVAGSSTHMVIKHLLPLVLVEGMPSRLFCCIRSADLYIISVGRGSPGLPPNVLCSVIRATETRRFRDCEIGIC